MTDIIAPIKEVTVYSDRALITRRGTIQLEAGEHELSVNDLPQFTRDSLRAAGQGPAGTRILNVDIKTMFYSKLPIAELQKLVDELEQLQQQQQLLQARQNALQDRRQWLRAIGEQSRDFARGLAQGRMKPQDCGDFFSFMATQSLQDAEAALALDLQIQHIQQEIDAKQRAIQQKKGYQQPDRLAAVVSVTLAEDGEFELEISYLVNNASWHPQYDVRVQMDEKPGQGTVELTYIGTVQQTTGESWENVELSLSTARPSLAAILPELKPWYLAAYTPLPPPPSPIAYAAAPASRVRNTASMPGGALFDQKTMFARSEEQADEEYVPQSITAEVAVATVEQTGTAVVFRIGRSADIPSDNQPHKTTIARDSLPCEFDYVSAPALEAYAHLRATITNTTNWLLLKGDASIFLNGEYVGTTQVKTTATTEKFKIFLGIDDKIKIKREPTERAVEKGNILQNDLRRSTYGYRITIHNYAATPRKIVVRDRLPVPQHEKVKVKLQHIQPQPVEHTKLELVAWEFTLQADEEKKIEYRFTIEQPQSLNITNLPADK